jgi:hypothetical protein
MTDTTPNLGLPELVASQAQKHVTHNEALRALDALVQLAVLDRDLAAPPGSPGEGERWIVAASASGEWAGRSGDIAAWQDSGWQFYAPQTGWLAYVVDEGALLAWTGSAWIDALSAITSLNNMTLLGVGTMADATTPLSAKLNNILCFAKTAAEGGDGDLRVKLSKEAAADTLSLLLQTNFSGRAEIGLTGDDNLHVKVSADGSSWTDALSFDRSSGMAKLNAAVAVTGKISPAQITADQNNYSPSGLSGARVLRLSSDAARTLTGLNGGSDGRALTLLNIGANPITLAHESASSSAANRFSIGSSVDLLPAQSASLWYDATSSRWRMVAATATTSYRLRQVTTILSSATYNVPPGLRALYVEAVGGGGGGGYATGAAAQASAGGGGAGGSGARGWLTGLAASYSVTIGAGGIGGIASSATAATDGGTTSFGSSAVAAGGAAGGADAASSAAHAGGEGGSSAIGSNIGDQVAPGAAGGAGFTLSASAGIGGYGGGAAFGGGGTRGRAAAGAGLAASANSGGGGSGGVATSATSRNGGDGGSGYVRVWEYY